MTGIMMWIT